MRTLTKNLGIKRNPFLHKALHRGKTLAQERIPPDLKSIEADSKMGLD